MPESINNKQVFSLTEVANSIRKTIAERYTSSYWIKAEINKLNIYAKSGHCFPELVDKSDGIVHCEMRATIWKGDFDRINKNFKEALNETLKDGIKVLLLATISYEPKYGLSLIIRDIDPSYSLGELEREKRATIEKLKKENLFFRNKQLTLARVPKRIAVISVETSKGYQDFIKVIDQNIFGYRFFHMLFPAVLQGDASIRTITTQLKRIEKVRHHFDAVAIIRGGGGDVGLSSFNNYEISKAVCSFPLPVFTGIGHSTNLTVCEMVAFQSAITPTDLGDFLIQRFHDFAVPVQRAYEVVLQQVPKLIEFEKRQFFHSIQLFQASVKNGMQTHKHILKETSAAFSHSSRLRLRGENESIRLMVAQLQKNSRDFFRAHHTVITTTAELTGKYSARFLKISAENVQQLEKIVRLTDPINVLKRGYSMTTVNGKLVQQSADVKHGDQIVTTTAAGKIESTVTKTIFPDDTSV